MPSRARWSVAATSEAEASALAAACGLQLPAARVLLARGYKTAAEVDQFLHARLHALEEPFQMLGMEAAVERVKR
ncbi:MAG: single-stranded-DNA-specific exonuclease RecJ, partial [Acidobacteria bacterium]|nr:single-stranded-DNA-specific exonuclease RecJ [Acidobacteriota bacterium]